MIPWLDTELFHAKADAEGNRPYSSIEPTRLLALIAIAEAAQVTADDILPAKEGYDAFWRSAWTIGLAREPVGMACV